MPAPTEWTFGGLIDWTSVDTLRGTPVNYVMQAIIEAVKERCVLAEKSIPSLLSNAYNPLQPVYDYTYWIQDTVDSLIQRHVNQTGGIDFTGETSIPMWNETDIIAAIGADERLIPSRLTLLAEWCYQQYQLINTCRYPYSQSYVVGIDAFYKGWGESSSYPTTAGAWAEALSLYNASDWISGSVSTYLGYARLRRELTNDNQALFVSTKKKFERHYIFSALGIDVDIDVYCFLTAPNQSDYGGYTAYNYFWDGGVGWIENAFNLIQTFSRTLSSPGYIISDDFESGKPDESPDPGGEYIWSFNGTIYWQGTSIQRPHFLYKPDFNFKDW